MRAPCVFVFCLGRGCAGVSQCLSVHMCTWIHFSGWTEDGELVGRGKEEEDVS